jgi:hypothetical protein
MSDPPARIGEKKGKKVNATKYQGIPPRQTPAQRAERILRATLGPTAYAEHRAERESYYRDLIRKTKESK